jgi:Tfp pilus assembly protein PilX
MILDQFKKQSGQVLLVVVLVTVVSLTVGLSVASKSITSFKTTTEEADSQKALHAAEAGIERAIQTQVAPSGVFESSNYTTTITDTNVSSLPLNAGNLILRDEGIDLWLTNYPDYSQPASPITTFTVSWDASGKTCESTTSPIPAMEIVVVSGTKASPTLTRYAYDPCSERRALNNFTGQNLTNIVSTFPNYSVTVTVADGLIARIIPIYGDSVISASTSNDTPFPSQGKIITSTGESGDSKRKVTVFQGHPAVPIELFPYSIFSPR